MKVLLFALHTSQSGGEGNRPNRPTEFEKLKAKMREYRCSSEFVHDYESYKKRLLARISPARRKELLANEAQLKRMFVESIDKVIDGGMELKVANRLGVKSGEK